MKKEECQNCPCLVEKEGKWFCDEAQQVCETLDYCPEVIEGKEIPKPQKNLIIIGDEDKVNEIQNYVEENYKDDNLIVSNNLTQEYWIQELQQKYEGSDDIEYTREEMVEIYNQFINHEDTWDNIDFAVNEFRFEKMEGED